MIFYEQHFFCKRAAHAFICFLVEICVYSSLSIIHYRLILRELSPPRCFIILGKYIIKIYWQKYKKKKKKGQYPFLWANVRSIDLLAPKLQFQPDCYLIHLFLINYFELFTMIRLNRDIKKIHKAKYILLWPVAP